jgi:hypothetical protein
MNSRRQIILILLIALLAFLVGRHSSNVPYQRNVHADLEHRELNRVGSPDGIVDALLTEVVTDSLSSNGVAVYLVPSGTNLDLNSPLFERKVFYANRISNLRLVWREPRFLEIRYDEGNIYEFRNNWAAKEVQDYTYEVEVRIIPKRESFSLPE